MSSFRSQFKATPLAVIDAAEAEVEAIIGSSDSTYARFHELKHGDNRFRIYPAHPSQEKSYTFYELMSVVYLPRMVQKYDNNQPVTMDGNPVLEEKQRPVFNAKVHGNSKQDIVEAYIEGVKSWAKENIPSEAKRKEYLAPLSFEKGKSFGLSYDNSFIVYADKIVGDVRTFGRLQLKTSVKNQLNNLASMQDQSKGPISTDPFTDPDDGIAININYNKQATTSSQYYTVGLYMPLKPGSGGQITLYPLSDEHLERFMLFKPLRDEYRNVYTRTDFDHALKGLQLFDKKHGLNYFNTPEFVDLVTEYSQEWPVEGSNPQSYTPAPEQAAPVTRTSIPTPPPAPKAEPFTRKAEPTSQVNDGGTDDDLPFSKEEPTVQETVVSPPQEGPIVDQASGFVYPEGVTPDSREGKKLLMMHKLNLGKK